MSGRKKTPPNTLRRLYPVSLGCAKNRVDTEIMLALLEAAGYQVVSRPQEADLMLVNTCGFITPACQEAIDTILELAAYKQDQPEKQLVVTGCLVQRYQQELLDLLPEVDIFLGVNDFPRIVEVIRARSTTGRLHCQDGWQHYELIWPRRLTTPFYSAYLKIAEGCSHHCTYCTIPQIRGPYRSRPLSTLVTEAKQLAAQGVRELNLVAQDTTAYGVDQGGRLLLPELLRQLAGIAALQWIRLLYGHPARVTPELLRVMADHPQICPYFDLPVQHVSDRLLHRMGRGYRQKDLWETLARIRTMIPAATLRTSVIVGFPGESEQDFAELCQVTAQMEFDHLGVFAYQPEEGTPAAKMAESVTPREANRRARRLRSLQARLNRKKLRRLKGTIQPVLIEGHSEETELLLRGRLAGQAPEADGQVYINAGWAELGRLTPVRITKTYTYDLLGEVVGGQTACSEIEKNLTSWPDHVSI
ncbi:MAG TPA: 30S ribosomal protein S12 methylthiotransferase RimO [Desulfobacterales bacterium]|nr:30S ribosomal protein S12 methylthiotransferase RimO [Desulfobacterales bacterium]